MYLYDSLSWRLRESIVAKSAVLAKDRWVYNNGTHTDYSNGNIKAKNFKIFETPSFEDLNDFKKTHSAVDTLNLSDLSEAIKKGKLASMATAKMEVEYYSKWSFIFSSIFLSLLALPFSLGNKRSSNLFVGLGVSLLVTLSYLFVHNFALSLGRNETLPPLVAGWVTSVVSLLLSFFLLKRKI